MRAAIAGPGSAWRADVVRVLEPDEKSPNAEAVVSTWVLGDAASLRRSLRELASYDVVILQHEFRLYGWPDGPAVLDFVAGVTVPLIVVLHTVQDDPPAGRRDIVHRLIAAARAVVVQAEAAREVLISTYGADPAKVAVIAHGAASNLTGPTVPGIPHPVVVTWGLLRPGKGIERAIAAFARLGDRSPAPVYVVAGRTHPKYLAADGESYRDQLRADAERLGVADRVRFEPGYQDQESLRALARTADVVLLPYDSRDQVSSGVLVEALAAGKPVVATRFPHAIELLSGGAGLLVDHDDVDAMAQALGRVLYEPGLAARLSSAARREAEDLKWQAVGDRYLKLLDSVVEAR